MAKYNIPVKYLCIDTIEVESDTLEEAIKKVLDGKVEDIMIDKDGCYVDKTCQIDDNKDGKSSMEELVELVKEFN